MEFIDDLKSLKTLSQDQIQLLIDEINTNPLVTMYDYGRYEKLCQDNNIDEKIGLNLYYVLSYIFSFISDEKEIESGFVKVEKELKPFIPDELSEIWNYLKQKLPDLNSFQVFRKEKVLKRFFNRIEGFSIICDIRPIFDIERKKVIKYTYPIILSLRISGSEERKNYDLSENDLLDIKKEIDSAVSKLEYLKNACKNM